VPQQASSLVNLDCGMRGRKVLAITMLVDRNWSAERYIREHKDAGGDQRSGEEELALG